MAQRGNRPLALVTGASSGIGAAYARRLGGMGFDLVVAGRRRDRLEEITGDVPDASVEIVDGDLATDEGLSTLVEAAAGRAIDMLVNNAGVAHYMPFVNLPVDKTQELLRVDVVAPTMLARAVIPGMVERGSGTVVNLASLLAFSGSLDQPELPPRAVYAGTRSYVVVFSQRLASELAGTGVRVQVVCPGIVRTEFHSRQGIDLSRVPRMDPEDVVTASLASLERDELVCVPGMSDPTVVERMNEAARGMLGEGMRPELADRYR